MLEMRACAGCVTPKPIIRFRFDKPSSSYRSKCKDCESKYNRARPKPVTKRDPADVREAMRRYRQRLRKRGIIKSAEPRKSPGIAKRSRAKTRSIWIRFRDSTFKVRVKIVKPALVVKPKPVPKVRIKSSKEELKVREAARKRSPHSKALSKLRKFRRKHAEGSFTPTDIENLKRLQEDRCAYCGQLLEGFHIDHVMPLAKQGTNNPTNLLLACEYCNKSKGIKTIDQWQQDKGFTLLPLAMLT